MKSKEYSAANSAIVTKATLAGIWRNRAEVTGAGGAPLPAAAVGPTIIMTGAPPAAQNASAT